MTSSSRAGDQTSRPSALLDLADLGGDLGAAVQQGDEFLVDPVDLGAEAGQGRGASGVGRGRASPGRVAGSSAGGLAGP